MSADNNVHACISYHVYDENKRREEYVRVNNLKVHHQHIATFNHHTLHCCSNNIQCVILLVSNI